MSLHNFVLAFPPFPESVLTISVIAGDLEQETLLAYQKVIKERVKGFPLDAVAEAMGNIVTPGAIEQHLLKIRRRRQAFGYNVPEASSSKKNHTNMIQVSEPSNSASMLSTANNPSSHPGDDRDPYILRPRNGEGVVGKEEDEDQDAEGDPDEEYAVGGE